MKLTRREHVTLDRIKDAVEFIIKDKISNSITGKKYYFYISGTKTKMTKQKISFFIGLKHFEYDRYFLGGEKLFKESDFDKKTIENIIKIIKTDVHINRNDVLDFVERVREFREAFNLPVREKPSLIPKDEYDLNFKLSQEENLEYLDACEDKDKVEVLDALVDEFYIWCGKVLSHGMQDLIKDAFHEIHGSNMSKLDANGIAIKRADGKVLKGENYYKPNLSKFL